MKKILITSALTLSLLSATASASADKYTFVASDNAPETQICMVAAASGAEAAQKEASNLGLDFKTFKSKVKCNGLSLNKFVKSFNKTKLSEDTMVRSEVVIMTAVDGTLESRICVQGAKEGMKAVREVHGDKVNKVSCNNTSLSKFISKYSSKVVQ